MSAERDNLIAAAVRERKIAADREADYRRMWNADPAGIRRLLTARVTDGGLAAGQVLASGTAFEREPDYPPEWVSAPGGTAPVLSDDPRFGTARVSTDAGTGGNAGQVFGDGG